MSQHFASKWAPRSRRISPSDNVGDNLKRAFSDDATDKLPERLEQLLKQLDRPAPTAQTD